MQSVSQDRLVGSGPSESASLAEPPMRPEAPAIQYDAFISYSHAADGRLAPALRSGLQRFATPWRLFRLTNPVRSLRIFQDTASLSANPELWPTIERALMASDWFVLLASPDAAASPWVGKEVNFWCRHKSPKRLLIVQTDGEITWNGAINDFDWTKTDAIPETLNGAFREEPRWVDARFARTEKQVTLGDPRFRDLVAELAAPLRGIPKDDLIGEDIRQHRRLNRWRNAGAAFLTALLIVATSAAVIAIKKRNEAEQNFEQAVDSADTLVTEVARRLKPLAGIIEGNSANSVHEILTKAEETYEKLVAIRPYSPDLQDKRAVMLMAFADIYADLGNEKEQAKRAQNALEIMQDLVDHTPENHTWQRDFAVSHCVSGDALKRENKLIDAAEQYNSGKTILDLLSTQDPNNTNWQRALMRCLGPMADTLYRQGNRDGAIEIWRKAKSIVDSLSSQKLYDLQMTGNFRAGVATAAFAIDTLEWSDKDPARSLSAMLSYRDAVQGLLKEDQDNPQRQDELAAIYTSIGNEYLSQLSLTEALEAYMSALAIIEPLAGRDPNNTKWQDALISNYNGVGDVFKQQNNLEKSLISYKYASERLDRLTSQDPGNAEWQHALAFNRWKVGQALAAHGDYSRALAHYRTAQRSLKSLLEIHPNNVVWQQNLLSFGDTIGNALIALNDAQGALAELEHNKQLLSQLKTRYPKNTELQAREAENLDHIGTIEARLGNHEAALKTLSDAQAVWRNLIHNSSDNLDFYYIGLLGSHNASGDEFFAQGDLNNAVLSYQKVKEASDQLTLEKRNLSRVDHLLKAHLVRSHYGVAKIFQAKNDFSGMLEAYRAGQSIAESMAHHSVDNYLWRNLLSLAHSGSAQALLSLSDYAAALKEFREAKEINEDMMTQYSNDPRLPLASAFLEQSIGDLLSLRGDEAGAVESFRQSVALLRQHSSELDNGQSELARALGSLSGHYLLAGRFAEARTAAEEGYSLDEHQIGILINLAHAEMFLGHPDAAMVLHMQHLNDVIADNGNKKWREVVTDDLTAFKRAGLANDNLTTVEQALLH